MCRDFPSRFAVETMSLGDTCYSACETKGKLVSSAKKMPLQKRTRAVAAGHERPIIHGFLRTR